MILNMNILHERLNHGLIRLFTPTDIAPLVFFRIAFGGIMLWEVWRYFNLGRIARYYITPSFYFPFFGFDWLQPWGGDGMYWHFHLLGALCVCILLGLFYRLSTVLFFPAFTYVFLLDQTHYLNHFYLISLLSFIMIFLPANRACAVDAWLRPALRSSTMPTWCFWLLRTQIAIPYVYGGIAKLNADWLQGEPMRLWLSQRTDYPILGVYFNEPWAAYFFSYGGLLFDLFVVPLLLWRKTRLLAFAAGLFFHLSNAHLFNIGIFPWFMIAATCLFFPADWRGFALFRPRSQPYAASAPQNLRVAQVALVGVWGMYLAWQLVMPFRHWLYPGNVSWTEEGHNFSWHMRLNNKTAETQLIATDPATGTSWRVNLPEYLSPRQIEKMGTHPHMLLQFAHHLGRVYGEQGMPQVEIRAWVLASLNSREPQLLVDPSVDLVRQPLTTAPKTWILPLVQPLKGNVPAVLVSWHEGYGLSLVNVTKRSLPLTGLRLVSAAYTLDGRSFGAQRLDAGDCLIIPHAHTQSPPESLQVACNKIIAQAQIDPITDDWHTDLDVYYHTQQIATCQPTACVIALPATESS